MTHLEFDVAVEKLRQDVGGGSFDGATEAVLELLSRRLFGPRGPEERGEGYRVLIVEAARGSKPRVTA